MHLKFNVLMIFWLQEMMRRTLNKEKNCPEIKAFFGKIKKKFYCRDKKTLKNPEKKCEMIN